MRYTNHDYKSYNNFTCPVCGAILYPYDTLFLDMGSIVGCELCYAENDTKFAEMLVYEFLDQNRISYIDHQIDDIKESW